MSRELVVLDTATPLDIEMDDLKPTEADREKLGQILQTLGQIGLDRPDIRSIDINPLILVGSHPVVADALVEVEAYPS